MITLLAIGRKHDTWIEDGLERYQKRLKQPWDIKWELVPHSSLEGARARQEESERTLARLDDHMYVILLDETGQPLTSPALATYLEQRFVLSQPVTLVIGGAYGVSDQLKSRADFIWSLSPLVFPHQLVRLIVVEQLYRAQTIMRGQSYHNN